MTTRKDGLFRFLEGTNHNLGVSNHSRLIYYHLGEAIVAINYFDELEKYFGKTIAHLECQWVPLSSQVDLTIDCYVANSAFRLPFKKEDYLTHGILSGYNDTEYFAMFHHGVNAYSFYDQKAKYAHYLVRDPSSLPFWELCAPFKSIIHWWTADKPYQLVHGAFLEMDGVGLLLTGKSGSGKSTTTVGAVLGGNKTLGEDYLLVNINSAKAYSLYRTAKLDEFGIKRFPELKQHVDLSLLQSEERKTFFYLDEVRPGAVLLSRSIDFHMLPTVTHAATTSIQESTSAEGIKRLAPSTIFQLPRLRELTFKKCVDLCRKIPTYEILLGKNTNEVNNTIYNFANPPVIS